MVTKLPNDTKFLIFLEWHLACLCKIPELSSENHGSWCNLDAWLSIVNFHVQHCQLYYEKTIWLPNISILEIFLRIDALIKFFARLAMYADVYSKPN